MSRSFTPPDSLSKDDRRTLADVRRAIWTDSFLGMGYGSVTALTGHTIVSLVTRSKKLNRNTALLSFLLGGSLGSFLAATTTGKNQVHSLHHIFEAGATNSNPSSSSYSSAGGSSEQQQDQQLKEELSPEVLKQNRVLRRRTLQNALESHSGLNDSHGGHWVDK